MAAVLGKYGVSPWGTAVLVASPAPITPSLTNSEWIWAAEPNPPNAPPGDVGFRKTLTTPTGKTAVSATIILTADDLFTLHLNGALVRSAINEPSAWEWAVLFRVALNSSVNVFAVLATNGGAEDNAAGLLVCISILYSDGSIDLVSSDTTWKIAKSPPAGFELPSFDDSQWTPAVSLGAYGVSPWGTDIIITDPLGEHPAPLLRKSFTISKTTPIAHARLYYSAGGFASIALNAVPVSDHVLSPGFTKYDSQVQYVGLDVAPLLVEGENVIAAELGRSYYGITQPGDSWWNWNLAAWHGEPALRAVLSIRYTDGTAERIISDESWKVIEGPTRLDDVYGGENYDASFVIPEYKTMGFDDSDWDHAQVLQGPSGVLVNARQPPTRLTESLSPVSITEPLPGIFVAAFERVVAGWVRVTVTGPAKTLLTMRFGEKLNPDGTAVFIDSSHNFINNFQTDRFWLAGVGAPETLEPKFTYKGFQFVQIEGWPGSSPPTASDIVGQVVHDDLGTSGGFESSNDLLNKLHQAVVYTMLNNVHSFPSDCPTFEKKGWSGDAKLETEMFLSNFASSQLLAKYALDLEQTRVNGEGPPDVIGPDSGHGWNTQAPTWHSALILIPAWIYAYRGDKRILTEQYASMKNYIDFELGRSPNNIASTWLGDWNTPESSPQGSNPPEDSNIPATAYLYHMLDTMANIANVLGESSDATTFTAQASAVKNSFNAAYLNATTGHYNGVGDSGYRQSHNILSLAFNMTPDSTTAQAIADSVASDVVDHSMHLNTGALSTKYVLPMLSAYGHADTAFALSVQTTYPSWGFWIENGATTMWEHWSLEARSHDHSFLGTFEDWLYKYVLGIQSTGVAFETVDIVPSFTDYLASASGWMFTPFGNLTVACTNTTGTLTLDVVVPVGITATLIFPGSAGARVSESGQDLNRTQGVTVLPTQPLEPLRLALGSGQFSFVAS